MGISGQPRTTLDSAARIIENPVKLGPNVRITPQARYYAAAELTRRAGIPNEFFRSWKVSMTRDKTVFEIPNGTSKFITFPHASSALLESLAKGELSYTKVPSLENSFANGLNCIVPFVDSEVPRIRPLFRLADQNHLECLFDLPLSILLTLSRWEELLPTPRDNHGRFQEKNSIASIGGFLNRPIVDEYGLALEQAMHTLYPTWQKIERKLRVKISHDADHLVNIESRIDLPPRKRDGAVV